MDDFNQAVEELTQRQAAPVAEAKQGLAATRTALVQEWKTFLKQKPTLEANFQEAQAKHQKAIEAGVYYQDLARDLEEVYGRGGLPGSLQGIQANYDNALGQIDGLSEKDLNFPNILASLYNAPARLRDSVGGLEKLAERVKEEVKELESRVQQAVSSPTATVGIIPAERQASRGPPVEVETDFAV